MPRVLEKVERRLGEKLLLKGTRCLGPKCAMVRKAYPPGAHGKSRKRRRASSEFGWLLADKQKIRYLYGITNLALRKYSREAAQKPGVFGENLLRALESRLDNLVFRLGFADSRRIARQAVSHGHILVNGRKVTIPSYRAKKDDTVSVKESSLSSGAFQDLDPKLKKYESPKWVKLDKNKKLGTVVGIPSSEDAGVMVDATRIKEYYSR